MIYQIIGAIIFVTCAVCGTWYVCAWYTEKSKTERAESAARISATKRIVENNILEMYEAERQRRIAAETKCGIYQHQLERARQQMAKVKIGGKK